MPKKDTSIEDLGQSIRDTAKMVVEQINLAKEDTAKMVVEQINLAKEELGGRIDKVDTRLINFQRETNQQLGTIEGKLEAIENDVKALYSMLSEVQEDVKVLRAQDKKLDQRIYNLEQFAEALSQKTGVSFKA